MALGWPLAALLTRGCPSLRRVAHHPVLSQDQLSLQHFLTASTEDKKLWKMGKRKAEKDDLVQGNFFRLICQDVDCPVKA